MNQSFFHLTFVFVFIGFFVVRAIAQVKTYRERGRVEYKEGNWHKGLRLVTGLPVVALFFCYMFYPPLLSWAEFELPQWAQWLGVVLGIVSVVLISWIHWALGVNFSSVLHIRDEHTLVTHGPYQWVRHPMYTTLFIYTFANYLLTKNWLIGSLFFVPYLVIVIWRVNNEEQMMLEKFGEQYQDYMKRTGRFLPKII